MLNNVTIIIFTRNRYDKASVVVRFWLRHGAKILLLDASTDPVLEEEFAAEKNVVYFKGKSFWERALFASNNLETQYSLIHSDDSIVFPSAVIEGISILEKQRQIGYLYAPGNFSSWWFENSSWEFPRKLKGQSPYERMLSWAKSPNDLMWGALWRSTHLNKTLKIWGESMSAFPFESALHTTSLYLAGAALTSGQAMNSLLHLSRHWLAPEDETIQEARAMKSPFGIDLKVVENHNLFNLWKTRLLDGINEHIDSREKISSSEFNFLLQLYEENEPNKGLSSSGGISFQQRVREKLVLELKALSSNGHNFSSTAEFILNFIKQMKLIVNFLKRRRCGWFRSSLTMDFNEYELLEYGIESERFLELRLKNYHKIYPDY